MRSRIDITRAVLIGVFLLNLVACEETPTDTPLDDSPKVLVDADSLIKAAIEAHGSDRLKNARLSFVFRDRTYRSVRHGWEYTYERSYMDSLYLIEEQFGSGGTARAIDGISVELSASEISSIRTALNSVFYFIQLPYFLLDPGVRSRYLGPSTVEGQPYHMVEVTFSESDGGEDWQDRYVYWFHQQNRTMDYLAYRFYTGDGGARFRKAINVRDVNGVRFADYINYTHPQILDNLEDFATVAGTGQLTVFSEILTEDIQLELLATD